MSILVLSMGPRVDGVSLIRGKIALGKDDLCGGLRSETARTKSCINMTKREGQKWVSHKIMKGHIERLRMNTFTDTDTKIHRHRHWETGVQTDFQPDQTFRTDYTWVSWELKGASRDPIIAQFLMTCPPSTYRWEPDWNKQAHDLRERKKISLESWYQ